MESGVVPLEIEIVFVSPDFTSKTRTEVESVAFALLMDITFPFVSGSLLSLYPTTTISSMAVSLSLRTIEITLFPLSNLFTLMFLMSSGEISFNFSRDIGLPLTKICTLEVSLASNLIFLCSEMLSFCDV